MTDIRIVFFLDGICPEPSPTSTVEDVFGLKIFREDKSSFKKRMEDVVNLLQSFFFVLLVVSAGFDYRHRLQRP